ncbi:hypothetical protein FQN54_002314 [Arachnomyces sp. PD_36]|nr:hypothetical protein FQN54_002314 [Arachnomyces sp. PD_36]
MAETPVYPSRPTRTEDLIQHLAGSKLESKERSSLQALATTMILIFHDDAKSQYVPEATELSRIEPTGAHGEPPMTLMAFANAIIDGTADLKILNLQLLVSFAFVLRQAHSSLSATNAPLGPVFTSLQKRLDGAIQEAENGTQYQLQLLSTLSTVLDTMVDLKIYGLGRVALYEPLLHQLENLRNNSELRLAQAAEYARAGLLALPNDESSYHAVWRHAWTVAEGATEIAGAVPTMDPGRLFKAIPYVAKVPDLIKSLVDMTSDVYRTYNGMDRKPHESHAWYVALRYTDMLLEANAFEMLEEFVRQSPCHDEEPFWCGLYARLEQAWIIGDSSLKQQIIKLIETTITQTKHKLKLRYKPRYKPNHERAQMWVGLVADTAGKPDWRRHVPNKEHRFALWRNKKFENKLTPCPQKMVPLGNLPTALLERAWLECNEAQRFYADMALCEYYSQGERLEIKRLSGDMLDMEQCYINLSVIEHQQDNKTNPPDSGETEHQPSALSLFTRLNVKARSTGEDVPLDELFDARKHRNGTMVSPKRILIRGRAGVGKTTLCKKIVHDFLRGQLWSKYFDRIIWIPLRSLKEIQDLEKWFQDECFPMRRERECLGSILWNHVCDETDERTLLLLDGLDEISGERHISGVDLTEKLKHLLNRHHVIVTSRPYAVHLSGLHTFDLELDTMGFHLDQVQAYLTKVVDDKDKTERIWSFIQGHWIIQGLVQIPIQLDALCYSWDDSLSSGDAPETMTALYQAIELKLWKKDILHLTKPTGSPATESDLQRMYDSEIKSIMEDEIILLQSLAFAGMCNDIVEFKAWHQNEVYKHFKPTGTSSISNNLARLSFLRTPESSARHENRSYYFLHLTFQEYFAAQYFVRCWKSRLPLVCLKLKSAKQSNTTSIPLKTFIQQEKYSGRYDIFWRFVVGLLQDPGDEELCGFFKELDGEPRDLLGPAHQRLLMRCFAEISSSDSLLVKGIQTATEDQLRKWLLVECDLHDGTKLGSEMEFPERILRGVLQGESKRLRRCVLEALSERPQISPETHRLVVSYLDDGDGSVRSSAVHTLDRQGTLSGTDRDALVSLLEDDNWHVRTQVLRVLSEQPKLAPELSEAVLAVLVSKLRDGEVVQILLLDVFQKQSELPETIINTLVSKLGDSGEGYRAADILEKKPELPEPILQALVSKLEDNEARRHAAGVLSKQSELPKAIIKALISRLDIQGVGSGAACVLAERPGLSDTVLDAFASHMEKDKASMGSKVAESLSRKSGLSELILNALLLGLHDDSGMSLMASDALHDQTSLPEPILNAVVSRLGDKDVGRTAALILDKRSGVSTLILPSLISFLKEGDTLGARCAAKVLESLPDLSDDTINTLIPFLRHDDPYVRMNTIQALGNRPEQSTVCISALLPLLKDESDMVKLKVGYGLGYYPLPEETYPTLISCLKDKNNATRAVAAYLLGKESALPDNALGDIASLLMDTKEVVRRLAGLALQKYSNLPGAIQNSLIPALGDKEAGFGIVEVLCRQSALSNEIVDGLLSSGNDDVRNRVSNFLMEQSTVPKGFLDVLMTSFVQDGIIWDWFVPQDVLLKHSPLSRDVVDSLVLSLMNEGRGEEEDIDDDEHPLMIDTKERILNQHVLSDKNIKDLLVVFLKDGRYSETARRVLWKQTNFYSILPDLDMRSLRALFQVWLKESFQDSICVYIHSNSLYVSMPERLHVVSLDAAQQETFKLAAREARMALDVPE